MAAILDFSRTPPAQSKFFNEHILLGRYWGYLRSLFHISQLNTTATLCQHRRTGKEKSLPLYMLSGGSLTSKKVYPGHALTKTGMRFGSYISSECISSLARKAIFSTAWYRNMVNFIQKFFFSKVVVLRKTLIQKDQ